MTVESALADLFRPGIQYQLSLNERVDRVLAEAGVPEAVRTDLFRLNVPYQLSLVGRVRQALAAVGIDSSDLFTSIFDAFEDHFSTAVRRSATPPTPPPSDYIERQPGGSVVVESLITPPTPILTRQGDGNVVVTGI